MARKTLIQVRRDTAANWTSGNPTLSAGEPGFETDTGKVKVGDGSTAWNSLAYIGGVTSYNSRTGAVVPVTGDYYGAVSAALTGATQASRYVGSTTTGSPGSGTFAVGDFVIARDGHIYVCTTAGSPGTWSDVGSAGSPVSSVFARTGAVVAGNADYLAVASGGLTGATTASRYVGGTTTGHPVSGTFSTGDFVIDQSGSLWICTSGGTPGTWVALGSASGNIPSGGAAGQVVGYGGTSGTGTWVYDPGFEIAYAQITSPASITDTAEATATALITCTATFDGFPVLLDVYSQRIAMPTGATSNVAIFTLFEGSTQIGRLASYRSLSVTPQNQIPVNASYRFTPSAGSHTYKLCCFVSAATGGPILDAGAGGTGTPLPAFMRFTKI